ERDLLVSRLASQGTRFKDECGRNFRPCLKPANRHLKRPDLLTFSFTRIERVGAEVGQSVGCGVRAYTSADGCAPDDARQAITAMLDTSSVPASLGRRGTRHRIWHQTHQ